jgi:hypothetical protein
MRLDGSDGGYKPLIFDGSHFQGDFPISDMRERWKPSWWFEL